MVRLAKAVAAVFGIILIIVGWGAWAESGHAPRWLAAGFDMAYETVTGRDPMTRCTIDGEYVGIRHCFDFDEPRRFTGIYVEEFEGSRFLEGAAEAQGYHPADSVSLVIDEWTQFGSAENLFKTQKNSRSRIFAVDLVGRKARTPTPNSWIGLQDCVVVVDQMKSARLIREFEGYVPDSILNR